MSQVSSPTFYLFAKPSFIEGMGRILDFGNNLQVYNKSRTPQEADTQAISDDWRAVGNDIESAINKYERQ